MWWGRTTTAWAVAGTLVVAALVGLAPTPAGATPSARRLAGTVTSEAGGPVAGVRVRLYRDGVGYVEHFADTAPDGGWAIEDVPAGAYRVVFTDPTLAHVAEWWGDTPTRGASAVVTVAADHDETLDVALAPGAEVGGTISTPGRFDVALYDRDPDGAAAAKVLTGVSGSFRFRGLAAGPYHVAVRDPAGRLIESWGPGQASRETPYTFFVGAGGAQTAVFAPVPRSSIGGTVIDSEGPVAGVVVQAYDSRTGAFVRSARTDENGDYRITSLPAGCYKPVFRDPTGDHVTTWHGGGEVIGNAVRGCLTANGALTYDQELVATATLAGRVTDGEDPLAGIKVALYREGATVKILTTAADGTWSASGLEPGSYVVGYSDPGRTFVPEYHQDRSRSADADPIALWERETFDVEAVLGRR